MRPFLNVVLLCLLIFTLHAAYCNGKPGAYYTNNQTIWASNPRFLKKHQYGKLYEIGEGSTTMKLLHVYGNSYQMGFAQGQLLKQ